MPKRVLLISAPKVHGMNYWDHCQEALQRFIGKNKVLFIPYARPDGWTHDEYADVIEEVFRERMGFTIQSIHRQANSQRAVEEAESILIGGGNTFVLLRTLYETGIMPIIQERVSQGLLDYIGVSAGVNVACPTIKTTNDDPIVQPPSFDALGLFPYQIKPHYLDPNPNSTYEGEPHPTKIKEYHAYNDLPVIGLREGAWLHCEDSSIRLEGLETPKEVAGARIFRKGEESVEVHPGEPLEERLAA